MVFNCSFFVLVGHQHGSTVSTSTGRRFHKLTSVLAVSCAGTTVEGVRLQLPTNQRKKTGTEKTSERKMEPARDCSRVRRGNYQACREIETSTDQN